ncbi:MAG: hypothetical protein ABT940_06925 [Alphaproteobacteria bacterium]
MVRVYIATTEGPSEIQRITAEDEEVRSVVCLDGTAEALPISRDYDPFVRKPTGIVEHLFGHPSFRVDVSSRISCGQSWQLGILAAHALHAAGRLADCDMDADAVLWVTGEVRHDLAVAGVERCRDKVRQSETLLIGLVRKGIPTTLLVPEANLAEVEDEVNCLGLSAATVSIRGIDDWAAADLDVPPPSPSSHRRWLRPLLVVTALLMVATGAYATWTIRSALDRMPSATMLLPPQQPPPIARPKETQPGHTSSSAKGGVLSPPLSVEERKTEQSPATTKPETPPVLPEGKITIGAIELRAPSGAGCGSLRFSGLPPEEVEIDSLDASGTFENGSAQGLCGLEFRIGKSQGEAEPAWIYLHSNRNGASDLRERHFLHPGKNPVSVKIDGNPWAAVSSWRATLMIATGRGVADLPEDFPAGSPDEVEALLRGKSLNVVTVQYVTDKPEMPRFR